MSIFTASNLPAVRDAAVAYFYEGISVLPLTGKKAVIGWEERQREVAIPEQIHDWHKRGLLQNVGIVCGRVSHNLVVMDLDGQAAIETFERTFPYLLDTFTVLTGSGKGRHLYYRVDDLPPTTRLVYAGHQAIELRANGCYVVAPPSIHPETHAPYRPMFSAPIKRLPNMNGLKHWLYSQLARKNEHQTETEQRTKVLVDTPRWAEAALAYECRDMRLTKEGNRANQLFISARNLGQIVGDGNLSQGIVIHALLRAAVGAGLSESESLSIIKSGVEKGMAEPRSLQWQRRSK
jgi:hypothetical protein